MNVFLQQLINGLSLGSVYALIALGYTMIYGIIKLINFAHGDIYMLGAFVGFYMITIFHVGLIPSILVAMVACGIFGVVIEKVAYRPLRKAPRIAAFITAIGVSLLLENGGLIGFGATPKSYPDIVKNVNYKFLNKGLVITNKQVMIFVVTVVLMVALEYMVSRTKIGKSMRAVSQDQDAAKLMGINVDTVISATFAIGSALAAAGGVLVGMYYNTIDPLMGIMPGLKAFVAAVLGGIGLIPGAMVGGLIMGVVESLVSGYINSMYRDGVAFAILILILLIKPTGLFGHNVKEKV